MTGGTVARVEDSRIARRRAAAKEQSSSHYTERRRDVVKAAASVFKSLGVATTSINDVGRAANIDRATIYYYFSSKDELFEAVVMDALVENVEMAERLAAKSDSVDKRLGELIRGLMQSYEEYYPHLYVFLQDGGSAKPDSDIAGLTRRFNKATIAIIEQGIADGIFRDDLSPRVVAYGILGMVNWTHRWYDRSGSLSAEQVAGEFVALVEHGLLRQAQP